VKFGKFRGVANIRKACVIPKKQKKIGAVRVGGESRVNLASVSGRLQNYVKYKGPELTFLNQF